MKFSRGLVIFALLIVCQIAAILAPIRAFYWLFANQDQAWEVVKGYDHLGNTVINGKAIETISSHANRAKTEDKGWGCKLCGILDWVQTNHCANSVGT